MSTRRGRWLLWTAGVLFAPLPYGMVTPGHVPVVRFAWLAGVSGAYAATVDGSGVAWVMTAVLAGHAVLYALALALAAALAARFVPEASLGPVVWSLVAILLVVGLVFEPYHTPFAAETARTGWLGLFP